MRDSYQKLFGTSGIRRKVSQFPKDFAFNLGRALGTYSRDKKIAIGKDTRESSDKLEEEFIGGLLSTGHDVIKLGIVPTPTLGIAAQDFGTGVMITASHNPPQYNGFKFWGRNGAYTPEQESDIEKIFYLKQIKERVRKGKISEEDYVEKHISLILKKVGRVEKKIRVLIDCANGSGSVLTPILLRRMGCDVIAINIDTTKGKFPHGLEPTKENLKDVCKEVKEGNVDIGLVHDGDADRTAAISKEGKLIDWDSFLAILAYGKKKVITTVDASMRIEEVCENVVRVPVGDVAVANSIVKENADFGGEPSGSFIFPQVHLFPDGPLTAAITAKLVSEEGEGGEGKFYEILDSIRTYPMERLKIPCKEEKKYGIMNNLRQVIGKEHILKGRVDYTDGIRVSLENGWFLIRPSGTEPYMRVTAEGRDKSSLKEVIKIARDILKNSTSS
jgi:phosphoglucosamine mutase